MKDLPAAADPTLRRCNRHFDRSLTSRTSAPESRFSIGASNIIAYQHPAKRGRYVSASMVSGWKYRKRIAVTATFLSADAYRVRRTA